MAFKLSEAASWGTGSQHLLGTGADGSGWLAGFRSRLEALCQERKLQACAQVECRIRQETQRFWKQVSRGGSAPAFP